MLSLNFAPDLSTTDTIASVTVNVAADTGFTDPNASNLRIGTPIISGFVVSQMVGGPSPGGFQPGVTYLLTMAAVTAAGETVVLEAKIQVTTPI